MSFAALGSLMALAASSPFAAYVDHSRVLVISSPSDIDAELKRQEAEVAAEPKGMGERDLVVIRAVGAQAKDDHGRALDASAVRQAAGLEPGRFGVALIGKDGGVKLRRRDALPLHELFETVDAMPMRQAEMKRTR